MTTEEKAKLLIASVKYALAKGVQHFDKSGRRLLSAKEVLECLRDEGEVVLQEPPN
jgi:hypothetical protein